MKYTNVHNLHDCIVRALTFDEYDNKGSDYSATSLLKSPRQVILQKENENAIVQDASKNFYSVFGTAVHSQIERANETNWDLIFEKRYFMDVAGKVISGQIDAYDVKRNMLLEIKTTSVYAVKNGEVKPDWEKQTNINVEIMRDNGISVRGIKIIAICRDWSQSGLLRDRNYPKTPFVELDVPLWTEQQQKDYILERVTIHSEAEDQYKMFGTLPNCTDEERWKQPDKHALMVKGKKRAIKLYTSLEKATDAQTKPEHYIEFREGKANKCENYCLSAQFCDQYLGTNNT